MVEVNPFTPPASLDDSLSEGRRGMLLFSVRDTGIGVPEEKQGLIFETFVQADGSTAGKFGGSGLGLAISKELAELMGGSIWVRSREGQGAIFYFTAGFQLLPEQAPERPAAPRLEFRPKGDALRVLVADDNEASKKLARRLLEKRGHSVVCVPDGSMALEALKTGGFDLLLTNVRMPSKSGLALVKEIRAGAHPEIDPKLPIVAITGHALQGDRERFLEAGMDDYLPKPLNSRDFYAVIDRVAVGQTSTAPPPAEPPPSKDPDALAKFLDAAPRRLSMLRSFLGASSPCSPDFHEIGRAAADLDSLAEGLAARPLRARAQSLRDAAAARDLAASRKAFVALESETLGLLEEMAEKV